MENTRHSTLVTRHSTLVSPVHQLQPDHLHSFRAVKKVVRMRTAHVKARHAEARTQHSGPEHEKAAQRQRTYHGIEKELDATAGTPRVLSLVDDPLNHR